MAPRFAKRVDDNQAAIVRELRQIPGVTCAVIGQPVDLLVGYQSRNFLFEVKRPDKAHRPSSRTPAQIEFLKRWQGQVRIVTCTEDILTVLQSAYRHAPDERPKTHENPPASDPQDCTGTRTP